MYTIFLSSSTYSNSVGRVLMYRNSSFSTSYNLRCFYTFINAMEWLYTVLRWAGSTELKIRCKWPIAPQFSALFLDLFRFFNVLILPFLFKIFLFISYSVIFGILSWFLKCVCTISLSCLFHTPFLWCQENGQIWDWFHHCLWGDWKWREIRRKQCWFWIFSVKVPQVPCTGNWCFKLQAYSTSECLLSLCMWTLYGDNWDACITKVFSVIWVTLFAVF